jgi:hypothetical protein
MPLAFRLLATNQRIGGTVNMKAEPKNDHRSAWSGTVALFGISIACVLGAWVLIEAMNRLLR